MQTGSSFESSRREESKKGTPDRFRYGCLQAMNFYLIKIEFFHLFFLNQKNIMKVVFIREVYLSRARK